MPRIDVLAAQWSDKLFQRVGKHTAKREAQRRWVRHRFVSTDDDDPFRGDTVIDRQPLPVDDIALFTTARRIADQWADDLERRLPGIFTDPIPGTDMRGAFVAAATLRLGLDEIPRIAAFVRSRPSGRRALLVDFGVGPDHVEEIARLVQRKAPRRWECLSTASAAALERHATVLDALPPSSHQAHFSTHDATLLLVGGPVEVPALRAAAQALEPSPVAVLAKSSTAPATAAASGLASSLGATCLDPLGSDGLLATGPASGNAGAWLLTHQSGLLEHTPAGDVTHTRLQLFLRVIRLALGLDAARQLVRPRFVVGALDRTPIGALVRSAHDTATKVIDIQHGTLVPFQVTDLMPFDMVLAWNEASARCVKDEAGKETPVVVVGNPRWTEGSHEEPPSDVTAWAGSDRVVVLLPQPPKGPYLTRTTVREVVRGTADCVRRQPGTRLIVKLRPRDDGTLRPEDLGSLQAEDRVLVVSDDQLPIGAALRVADVVVSTYSTGLADALSAGVAAVSYDPGRVLRHLDLDFASALVVTTSRKALRKALATALESGEAPELPATVFPDFDRPYVDRLEQAFRTLDGPLRRP